MEQTKIVKPKIGPTTQPIAICVAVSGLGVDVG